MGAQSVIVIAARVLLLTSQPKSYTIYRALTAQKRGSNEKITPEMDRQTAMQKGSKKYTSEVRVQDDDDRKNKWNSLFLGLILNARRALGG
jgi:hypothetical protein